MAATTNAWPLKRLKSITSKIGSGATPRGGKNGYRTEGISLIRSLNVYDFNFSEEDLAFIGAEQAAELDNVIVQKDDILLNITGASVARCCMTNSTYLPARVNQHVAIVRVRPDLADARFVLYCINSPHFKSRLLALAQGGATREALTKSTIEDFEISQPPLPLQKRISGILFAYDELIENNQRRIRILEEMAHVLYREWFVSFRFPGNEKLPRVASPIGDIPHGWEVKSLSDVCESVSYGYTASAVWEKVGPKFLRITDIVPDVIGWADVPFCKIPEKKAPKYLLKHGDIVVARTGATTGYAKRLNKLHPDTVFASYLVRARAKAGVSNLMLGILMESNEYKQFIKTNIGGSAQPQANAVVLTSMRLAMPPPSISREFDRLVEPMIDEAELLAVKNQNLRRTRDLLLPRLLSGNLSL